MNENAQKSEDPDTRLRRLKMRSWRRGMKEMDLILGGFADTALAGLGPTDLDDHEALMDEPDQDIYAWISGAAPIPTQFKPAIARILSNMSAKSP